MRVRAPGRVNLIGGHVDFHEGPVVCAAIDRFVEIDLSPANRVVLRSADFDGVVDLPADGTAEPGAVEPKWGRLVGGVLRTLADAGRPPVGFAGSVSSNLVIGGGLSSSAAFEVAIAVAAGAVAGWSIPPMELARAAQRAEHIATGVPCGIADQVASMLGGVIRLDCRDLSTEFLALPDRVSIVVVDSGVPRTLEGSLWTARRADSFAAAEAAGLRVLRDATFDQVRDHPQARHVVEEIDRVWRFAEALRDGDIEAAGRLMTESHRSSRDLYGSSIPELDRLVDELLAGGAYGARLTGGGFGGCVVALVTDSLELDGLAIDGRIAIAPGAAVTSS